MDSARHPTLALLPSAALLSVIWLIATLGRFSSEQVLALTLGMTMGMLCTNGIALGMGRRASELISLGKVSASRRYLGACSIGGVLMTLVIAGVVVGVEVPGLNAISENPTTFVLAAAIIALVWVLAAALSLVGRAGWTGAGLCAGVAVAAVVDRVAAGDLAAHLAVAVTVGAVTVLLVLAWALNRELTSRGAGQEDVDRTLPSLDYLTLEAAPYFLYGTLGAVTFAAVHVIGWVGAEAAMPEVATLEMGLFLTLGPVMLGAGLSERALRLFWLRAGQLQATTKISQAGTFNSQLTALFRTRMRAYVIAISAMSLLTVLILESLLSIGVLTSWVPSLDVPVFRLVYMASLVGFGLLGWAQFAAMHGLALTRWRGPLGAIAVGTVVTIAVGIAAVSAFGYGASPLGLVAGAAAYAALGLRSTMRVLPSVDHIYAHAL
jgi:hypothetical protein